MGQIRDFFRSDFSTFWRCFWSEKVPDLSHLGPFWPILGPNLINQTSCHHALTLSVRQTKYWEICLMIHIGPVITSQQVYHFRIFNSSFQYIRLYNLEWNVLTSWLKMCQICYIRSQFVPIWCQHDTLSKIVLSWRHWVLVFTHIPLILVGNYIDYWLAKNRGISYKLVVLLIYYRYFRWLLTVAK